jgi:hypothetical protein
MRRTPRAAVSVAAVALIVAMSRPVLGAARDTQHPASATRSAQLQTAEFDVPKLTVRVTPLERVKPGDTRRVVSVPRHVNNRVLRVILESEGYYSLSDAQLDGEDAPQSHSFIGGTCRLAPTASRFTCTEPMAFAVPGASVV